MIDPILSHRPIWRVAGGNIRSRWPASHFGWPTQKPQVNPTFSVVGHPSLSHEGKTAGQSTCPATHSLTGGDR